MSRRGVARILRAGRLVGTAAMVVSLGCGVSPDWTARLAALDATLAQADAQGAARCAPRELALARAHREFAEGEAERGNRSRAEEHLAVAEPSADAAIYLSPPDHCGGVATTDQPAATVEPPPLPPPDDPPPESSPETTTDAYPDSEATVDPPTESDVETTQAPDGDEDGIPDDLDACPTRPEDMDGDRDDDGCPDSDDADGDGVANDADACPSAVEDRDGFQDEDGCPDPDNDADGVLDGSDPCPNAPGADGRACPTRYTGVEVQSDRLLLTTPITFDARNIPSSAAIETLRAVARALRDRPGLSLEIASHWDSEGTDAENVTRTQARAEAIRRVLVETYDIAPARLRARGYGEAYPIESNTSEEGRAANRRIELRRTDGTGAAR